MATPQEEIKRKLPGVVDIAYEQYKRDLPRYRMAKEIMSKDVVTITPEASLDNAARIMGAEAYRKPNCSEVPNTCGNSY